ncbi:MAG: SdiA-regulated domain-containing protein [Blastocatellia bacterium]|nr:SdiA-regulated domain-containing protein [Blastocatellia bacterium]
MEENEAARLKAMRIKVYSRLIAGIVGVLLVAAILFYVVRSGMLPTNTGEVEPEPETPVMANAFQGGSFESSGVVFVPGSEGVLFVDDGRPGEIFWAQIDGSGRQVGMVKPIQLGASVNDPEGITFDGSYYYIIGSQSNPEAGERNAIVRFTFDSAGGSVKKVEAMTNLRDFLLEEVPELKGRGEARGSEGGLNIEGIVWDPLSKQMLLGLRSPLIEDQGLILPFKLRKPNGPFSTANVALGQIIKLRLGDAGIRDIHYDIRLKSFLIIAGAPKDHQKGPYSLWEWDGPSSRSEPRKKTSLDPRLKPEGITRVEVEGSDYLFIVYDSSSYMKLDYTAQ